jgi:hypothetical protein
VDNACGAVARIISSAPQAVPLQHVLPVLLTALPLREDHEEDATVWTCLTKIVATFPQFVVPHSNLFLTAVAKSLGILPDSLSNDVANSVRLLGVHMGAQLNNVAASLPLDLQQTLSERVNKI